jgi:hypothetical protein
MKGIVFVVAVLLGIAIFGLPILGSLMAILVIILGIGVEAAMAVGMVLTVALIVGMAIKVFFVDD